MHEGMRDIISEMLIDLEKAENGNSTAARRLRVTSVKFNKISHDYRRDSMIAEKKGEFKKLRKSVKNVSN